MPNMVEKIIKDTFLELADALETGKFGASARIAVTGIGSEHGEQNVMDGAVMAAQKGIDVTYIGTLENPLVKTVKATNEDEAHKAMEALQSENKVDGVVTMHYPFPIGVATIGRVITPATGKAMYVASTTGTAATDRVEGMVRAAVYGTIAAKACGNPNPTIGILNIEGARQTEAVLRELSAKGYSVTFGQSKRADGGVQLRGNDVLTAATDILVTDSLTGNVLMKLMSAFNTGGSYEAVGYGYGPGIGEGYEPLVMIISRASGAGVIANAISYAAELVLGDYRSVAAKEFEAANKAGLKTIFKDKKAKQPAAEAAEDVKMPAKEVVTGQIAGVEITDLEDAVKALWKAGVYAESGMGCTGPIVMVAEAKVESAVEILKKAGYVA